MAIPYPAFLNGAPPHPRVTNPRHISRITRSSAGHQLLRGLLFLETAPAVAISMATNPPAPTNRTKQRRSHKVPPSALKAARLHFCGPGWLPGNTNGSAHQKPWSELNLPALIQHLCNIGAAPFQLKLWIEWPYPTQHF
ncbi:MAG: hypothetical protein H6510_12330 [Acidobacteria bacterium]|nr:hypothetical protein [Acidobacteriota bacterium]